MRLLPHPMIYVDLCVRGPNLKRLEVLIDPPLRGNDRCKYAEDVPCRMKVSVELLLFMVNGDRGANLQPQISAPRPIDRAFQVSSTSLMSME